jgi:hypothetical protein
MDVDRPQRTHLIERRRLVFALGLSPLALLIGCGEAGSVKLGPGSRPIGSPPPKTGGAGTRYRKDGMPRNFQPG